VQRTLADQAEGGGIPERGGATVAEHHLIALGQREQLAQPGPDPPDQRLHRHLPM
jgi:hypothetical protein